MMYSPMRVGGLASGMDIDQIVDDLMEAEHIKVDKLHQQKQVMEWQKKEYRDINLKLKNLYDTNFDMKLSKSYLKYEAVGSMNDGSDFEKYFTVSPGPGAINGSYEVKVEQMAEPARLESKKLKDVKLSKEESLDLNAPIKSQIKYEGSIEKFTINDCEIEIDENDSLNDILNKISNSKAGVKAYYDEITDKVVIVSKETGLDANIEITDDNGLLKFLGFDNTKATGKNAIININGTEIEKTTNNFTVNGIRFDLIRATEGKTATFSTKNDPDAVIENIKEYVDTYNKTISLINDKLSEERYRDFPPLTDAQKKEMSEDDIKLWEEKARSGHLRSDPILDRIVRSLRSAISDPVGDNDKSLSAIGITTKDWREKGILHIDEKKLRDAIVKDPEAVMNIFIADGDKTKSKGVVNRVYDILKGGIRDITDKAGGGEFQKFDNSYLGKRIRDMEDRIDEWEERLWSKEEHYWSQFTAMEKAISAMNQQSMWLASQMGLYGG